MLGSGSAVCRDEGEHLLCKNEREPRERYHSTKYRERNNSHPRDHEPQREHSCYQESYCPSSGLSPPRPSLPHCLPQEECRVGGFATCSSILRRVERRSGGSRGWPARPTLCWLICGAQREGRGRRVVGRVRTREGGVRLQGIRGRRVGQATSRSRHPSTAAVISVRKKREGTAAAGKGSDETRLVREQVKYEKGGQPVSAARRDGSDDYDGGEAVQARE